MKKLQLLLGLLIAMYSMYGIGFHLAEGERIQEPTSRDYHFRYHNGQNDFNFYGVNKWAVKFNFRSAYSSLANCGFNVSGARLWFPIVGDSVTVELVSDVNGVPTQVLRREKVPVSNQTVDVSFSSVLYAEKVWLFVSYSTNVIDRFVAASNGGGTNSYYVSDFGTQQSLSNMANSGFNCELLFGLIGEFVLNDADLQLTDFSLEGQLTPRSVVYPSFSIYNHSDIPVTNAQLSIVVSTPSDPTFRTVSISIPDELAPRELTTFNSTTPWMSGNGIALPSGACQLKVVADLGSEFAETDTLLLNNTKTAYYNVFVNTYPIQLIENFVRNNEIATMSLVQGAYTPQNVHRLQYFPILTDSLSNLGSMQRFNWYSFNSVPRTVGSGNQRITGFTNDYTARFTELLSKLESNRTFISSGSCSILPIHDSDNIQICIQLSNPSTSMFTSAGISITSTSKLYVGLFKKTRFGTEELFSLERWIAYGDTIVSVFNIGSSISKNYILSSSNISSEELIRDYRVYYWLQGNAGGKIHYSNYANFTASEFSENNDELNHVPTLLVYPNPMQKGTALMIKSGLKSNGQLYIYNLRGQRIFSTEFNGEQEVPASTFPVSGIYLLKIETAGKQTTKRISIVK